MNDIVMILEHEHGNTVLLTRNLQHEQGAHLSLQVMISRGWTAYKDVHRNHSLGLYSFTVKMEAMTHQI